MESNNRGSIFDSQRLFPRKIPQFRMLEPDPELLGLEGELRQLNLLHLPEIQTWMRIATLGTRAGRQGAITRLKTFLQAAAVEAMRNPDPFRPYGPASLLSQGNLHLLDQQDGVEWRVPEDGPVTGMAILGSQGGGKSRFISHLCQQLANLCQPKRLFILDPKDELARFADRLNAVVVDGSKVRLDLSPPPGTAYTDWLSALMPQLGTTIGLIQGIELLQEAASISLVRLTEYRHRTGRSGELSLKDIEVSLDLVQDAHRGRRAGYLDAAKTAISRIITGSGSMFVCRQGVPLDRLFAQNVILTCRDLTDELACRWLAYYLLNWKFQEARNRPHTNRLENLLVIDDSQRFLGTLGSRQDAATVTTPLSHILSVLRTSGTGLCVATQLPAAVDPGVLALSQIILVVGGIHGRENQGVVGDIMNLDREQRAAVGRLVTREAVGFYARGAYRNCVHGWVPEVAD